MLFPRTRYVKPTAEHRRMHVHPEALRQPPIDIGARTHFEIPWLENHDIDHRTKDDQSQRYR